MFSFYSHLYLTFELLDHMIVLFLVFGNPILFSIVAATIYIPTNGIQEFLFKKLLKSHPNWKKRSICFICRLYDFLCGKLDEKYIKAT